MDKKRKTMNFIPKTSTPKSATNKMVVSKTKSQNLTDSPIQREEENLSQMDKDSFIRSLHLTSSDGSTDEDKRTECGDKTKDSLSGDTSMSSENNLSIEEYYWKSPWKNTPVHVHGLTDSTVSKLNSRKNKNMNTGSGKRKQLKKQLKDCSVEINKTKKVKTSKCSPIVETDKHINSKKTKTNYKNKSLTNVHILEAIESVCNNSIDKDTNLETNENNSTPSLDESLKSKNIKSSGKRSHLQRLRKTPQKFMDFQDEVRNELTEDSTSDIDIITISKDTITYSNKKNESTNQLQGDLDRSENCSGSDKKRKTLYSFKEKYSDEVINSQNESLNDNFLKSWDDIGTDFSISVSTEKVQKKQIKSKPTLNVSGDKHSVKKLGSEDIGGKNLGLVSKSSQSCRKSDDKDPGSTQKKSNCLIKRSPNSGQKSTKKRLSEILPIPQTNGAKRKIIEEIEDEYGSNKRQKKKDEQREVSLYDKNDELESYGEIEILDSDQDVVENVKSVARTTNRNSKRNISTNRKSKRSSKKINVENTIEDEVTLEKDVVPSCTDIPKSLDLENSYRDVDDSESQQSLNNSFNDETRNVRSRRGRSNVNLSDYVQPKKQSNKKTRKKKEDIGGKEQETNKVTMDTESHPCLRCEAKFKSVSCLKQHLMTVHNALWDKKCPEGLTDEKSLAAILKRIGKLFCPKCRKELKFMHYYRKHVKWCGRENEKYYCDLCKKYIMVMWEHEHSLMHVRRVKTEELDKEYEAARAEKKSNEETKTNTDGKHRKRTAARKAEKLLQNINKIYEGVVDLTSDEKDPDAEILSESSDDEVIFGDFMNDEELEDLKATNDSRQMYTGGHYANTFYKNLEHHKQMDRYNNVQFPQFCPRVPEWDPLSESDSKDYMPPVDTSPEFTIINDIKSTQKKSRQQLKQFESLSSKDFAFLFAGGPVWGLAWCPHPQLRRGQSQYLAVSCHGSMDSLHLIEEAEEGPGLIQIWNIGKLNQALQSLPEPKLEFCLAHDYGIVRRMTWCPFRSWQSKEDSVEEDKLRQLGLLAIACGDGSIRIFSIPNPALLQNNGRTTPTVYRPTPEVTLVGHKIRRGKTSSCTSVAWSVKEGNYILGGYGDGSVRIWDLCTTSTLLRISTPDQGLLLLPFRTFVPHAKTVTDLNWCPHSSKHFITCSLDRIAKVWSLDNLVMPQVSMKSSALTAAKWPTIVQSVVYSDDDVYVQQKGHVRLQSYGDLRDTNRAINSPLQAVPTGIWDVSVSNWHLMVFSCDFNGTVVATYYPAVFGEKKPHRSKLLLYKVFLKSKNEGIEGESNASADSNHDNSEANNNTSEVLKPSQKQNTTADSNHGNKDITQTYTDTVNKYYLEYIEQSTLDRRIAFEDNLDLTQFPLTSVYRVEVNPNLESCMFVASGGQAGIVQIHNVNRYLSFYAATDLRQELRLSS